MTVDIDLGELGINRYKAFREHCAEICKAYSTRFGVINYPSHSDITTVTATTGGKGVIIRWSSAYEDESGEFRQLPVEVFVRQDYKQVTRDRKAELSELAKKDKAKHDAVRRLNIKQEERDLRKKLREVEKIIKEIEEGKQ